MTDEEKWRDLVGGFILAFGDIELFTHHLWQIHCSGEASLTNLRPRIEALLKKLRNAPSKHKALIEPLTDALPLIDKRNTVSHNPAMVEVFFHSATGRFLFERRITSRKSRSYIDDAELTELRAVAEEIVTRLYMAIGTPSRQTTGPTVEQRSNPSIERTSSGKLRLPAAHVKRYAKKSVVDR